MIDLAACDIGCDEYGYPIRPAPVPVSPAGLAAGHVPNTPLTILARARIGINQTMPRARVDGSPR